MSYGEPIRFYSSAYADVVTAVNAQFVACGWTQVGVTGIYKSLATDENGYNSYVKLHDAGANLEVVTGCSVKDDLSDFRDFAIMATNWAAGHWCVIIFPLWFVAYKLDETQNDDWIIGGGLFRAFAKSDYIDHPYWCCGCSNVGGLTCTFSTMNGFQDGFRTRTANYDQRYCNPGSVIIGTGAAVVNLYRNMQHAGGLTLMPSIFSNPIDVFGAFGELYNAVMVSAMNLDRAGKSTVCGPCSILTVNGVKYFSPPRYEVFGDDQGWYTFLQLDSYS